MEAALKSSPAYGKSTSIPLMEILDLVADAVDEYDNAYNRTRVPKWITIDQLADWLTNKTDKLDHVDV